MKIMKFKYDEILVSISVNSEYDNVDVQNILSKYIQGLVVLEKEEVDFKYSIEININYVLTKCNGTLNIKDNVININIDTNNINGYLILGVLKTSIEYFMQQKGVYFLHGAGLRLGESEILIFGKRADGKSTISEFYSKFGEVIGDERIGLCEGDAKIDMNIPVVNIEKIKYIITPKILTIGSLEKWNILQHSLRYELYVELSENIRGCCAFEDQIVFQSIDNDILSKKRALFCEKIANLYRDSSYFIEGTKEDIIKFLLMDK